MVKLFVTLLLVGNISSCRVAYEEKNPYVYESADFNFFKAYLNDNETKQETAYTLVNHSYPIEVTLRDDGSFYYYLDNLGDGYGTWKHEDNHLSLYAERDMFIMKLSIHRAEGVSMPVIEFRDRFGPNFLELEEKL